MNFTIDEIETIKNSLILSLSHPELEDENSVIMLLDKIDEEYELD